MRSQGADVPPAGSACCLFRFQEGGDDFAEGNGVAGAVLLEPVEVGMGETEGKGPAQDALDGGIAHGIVQGGGGGRQGYGLPVCGGEGVFTISPGAVAPLSGGGVAPCPAPPFGVEPER